MSICSSLVGRFSPLVPQPSNLPWTTRPSSRPFLLKSLPTNFPGALQKEQQLSNLAVESPVIETQEEEGGDAHEALSEVPTTQLEEYPASPPSSRKKGEEVDDNFEDRFKLRNGREVFEEKTYLVGVERKGDTEDSFGIEESLKELAQLADTAGLTVVGSSKQKLSSPNPRTYIGSGKVAEIKTAIHALDVETVIFDDELLPGQLRNLEKSFGGDVRVCDRTALILDIFNQRAATHEAALQ
ncbi:hypothetical protein CRG98_044457, partial [Punica granatum]